ncbi:MAG TPA: hypothetical protein VNJ03_17235 [Vicinamibacterales bacterium]|nr:hypothetical protein [Vicinamibacterales bacterium]
MSPGQVDVEWKIAGVADMHGTRGIDYGSFPVAVETNWKIVGPK